MTTGQNIPLRPNMERLNRAPLLRTFSKLPVLTTNQVEVNGLLVAAKYGDDNNNKKTRPTAATKKINDDGAGHIISLSRTAILMVSNLKEK